MRTADKEALWKSLKSIFEKALLSEKFDKGDYLNISNIIFVFYSSPDNKFSNHLEAPMKYVYANIKQFLVEYHRAIRNEAFTLSGSDLLTFYATNWRKYSLWASFIDRRCDLLNRTFIRQRVEDRPKEYTILY
ncbi:unnamed protein product, partial [Hymenolepis diminuta]